MNFSGLILGVISFLIIGIFHPIVVKTEYYFGTKPWWVFLLIGIIAVAGSILINNVILSTICGVFAFTCFWTIKELFEQKERVKKGWFKRNPNRNYD